MSGHKPIDTITETKDKVTVLKMWVIVLSASLIATLITFALVLMVTFDALNDLKKQSTMNQELINQVNACEQLGNYNFVQEVSISYEIN